MTGGSMLTLFFSDIEGSTALLQRIGARYTPLLVRHQEIIREELAAAGGTEQSTEGDSFFVTFERPTQAVSAAVAVQRRLHTEPWPPDAPIRVRMGLHLGEVVDTAGGLVGLAIHHAARIGASANGGQIVVSELVRDATAGILPDGIGFSSLGAHRLKDMGTVELLQVTHAELPAEFPPLRAKGSSPNNLPAPVTSLVGRVDEAAAVADLLARHRVVTLTGAGGSGKSRLAVHVASTLGARYPDGIWFVELAALASADEVGEAVARALGVRDSFEAALERLRDTSMLVILDNCEHLLDAAGHVVARLVSVAPALSVLATAREPLGLGGEAVYRVPSLGVPPPGANGPEVFDAPAARLFLERARLAMPDFAPTARQGAVIGEICRRLDGIALAIELAAARTRMLAVEDIAARLDDRFRLLTGGSRTALPRQQTLLATVDWSFRLLSPAEQTLLVRLAVFRGGADLEAIEGVCAFGDGTGVDPLDVLDLLGSLLDKSLVVRSDRASTRYGLPETIRQFAAQRLLDGDGLVELRGRHADWFTNLVEGRLRATGRGCLTAVQELCAGEAENLQAACTWLMGAAPPRALRLLNQLELAAISWHGMAWVIDCLAEMVACGRSGSPLDAPPGERAIAHANLARAAQYGFVDADPVAESRAALDLLEQDDDPYVFALVQTVVQSSRQQRGDERFDGTMIEPALAAADRSGVPVVQLACRLSLSYPAGAELHERLLREMIRLAEGWGEEMFAAVAKLDLGTLLGFRGDGPEGLAIVRSVTIRTDELLAFGDLLQNAVFAALMEGEHGELDRGLALAEDVYARCLAHHGDVLDAALAGSVVARLRQLAGDHDGAWDAAGVALERWSGHQFFPFLARLARVVFAAQARRRGELGRAREVIGRPLGSWYLGSTDGPHRMLDEVAQLAAAMGRAPEAARVLATAEAFRRATGKPRSPACQREIAPLAEQLAGIDAAPFDLDDLDTCQRVVLP